MNCLHHTIRSLALLCILPFAYGNDSQSEQNSPAEVMHTENNLAQPSPEPLLSEKQKAPESRTTQLAKKLAGVTTHIPSLLSSDSALDDFSLLMNEIATRANNKNTSTEHAALAQIYFESLFKTGSRETKRALARMTYQLGQLLDKSYLSGARKGFEVNKMISDAFEMLYETATASEQMVKIDKLHQHLRIAIMPAMSGFKERLQSMPWGKIGVAGSALALAALSHKFNLLKRTSHIIGSSANLIDHISDSAEEARRQTLAFYASIVRDPRIDDAEEKDRKEKRKKEGHFISGKKFFMKWDNDQNAFTYLKSKDQLKWDDATKKTVWKSENHDGESILVDGTNDFTDEFQTYYNDPANWIKAPTAISERAVKALEQLQPLTLALGKQMQNNVEAQQEWYEGHHIQTQKDGRPRMVRVLVGKKIPSDNTSAHYHDPHSWEMRYVATDAANKQTIEQYKTMYGHLDTDKGAAHIPLLHHKDGQYYETFLPERNVLEQMLTTLRGFDSQEKPVGKLISVISNQLERNEEDTKQWFIAIGLPDSERAGRTATGRPIAHFSGNNMYFLGSNPNGSNGTENNGLYRHYPDKNILEKLTGSIETLQDETKGTGAFLNKLSKTLDKNMDELADWMFKNGLSSNQKDPTQLNDNVQQRWDNEKEVWYWSRPYKQADGDTFAQETIAGQQYVKIYPDRGINGLWDSLGVLARGELPVEAGIGGIPKIVSRIQQQTNELKRLKKLRPSRVGSWFSREKRNRRKEKTQQIKDYEKNIGHSRYLRHLPQQI